VDAEAEKNLGFWLPTLLTDIWGEKRKIQRRPGNIRSSKGMKIASPHVFEKSGSYTIADQSFARRGCASFEKDVQRRAHSGTPSKSNELMVAKMASFDKASRGISYEKENTAVAAVSFCQIQTAVCLATAFTEMEIGIL
jgi:hypothetical protein